MVMDSRLGQAIQATGGPGDGEPGVVRVLSERCSAPGCPRTPPRAHPARPRRDPIKGRPHLLITGPPPSPNRVHR